MHECSLNCVWLCEPTGCSLSGSSVHGIFQEEYWSVLSFPTPGDLPDPGIELESLVPSALAGGFFTTAPPGKPPPAPIKLIELSVPQQMALGCVCILFLLFSSSVVCTSLRPHGLQHTRLPCPTPSPEACSNSCPFSQWYHPTVSSSIVPFSSHLQSFPASGSFPTSQFFTSGRQSPGVSASTSVLPMNIQDFL